MNWTKRFLFISIGITAPLLVGIIILELIFGSWLREDQWKSAVELNIIRNSQINYDVENIYGKELLKSIYTRDSNGLRGSCANPKDISILTIGGSTTDQRYIPDGMTYQDVLQKLLSNKNDRLICVSNAGVDGHSTFGHLASFQNWFPLIVDLKPKFFLLYIGINDAGFRFISNTGFDERYNRNQSKLQNTLKNNSSIYSLLKSLRNLLHGLSDTRAYAGHSIRVPNADDYVATKMTDGVEAHIKKNTEEFEKRLKAILLQVASFGAKPICVSQPHLFIREFGSVKKGLKVAFEYEGIIYNGLDYDTSIKALNNSMKFLCKENDGFYLDMSTKDFSGDDFYDAVHLKSIGANRLGGYLFDEFINQKIPL